ncbi:MAG: carboxypeptidase-like regulatory domain-containing protein [Bacteroidota bacterium]
MRANFVLALLCLPLFVLAQTQIIRGIIIDKTSKAPIVGVTVVVSSLEEVTLGTSTNENGFFEIQNVLNYKNPSRVGYDPNTNSLFFRNHTSGLVPVLAFEFDF